MTSRSTATDAALETTAHRIFEEAPAALATALRRGGALADLFAEDTIAEQMTLRIRRGEQHEHTGEKRISGVGVRVVDDARAWYAAVDAGRDDESLHHALRAAASRVGGIVDSPANAPPISSLAEPSAWPRLPSNPPPLTSDPSRILPDDPTAASVTEKRALLLEAADAACSLCPDSSEICIQYQGSVRRTAVVSSDGRSALECRPLVGLRVDIHRSGQHSYAIGGSTGGLGRFFDAAPEAIAAEAARRLRTREASTAGLRSAARTGSAGSTRGQDAGGSPVKGTLPVVIAGGWGGVWLHEIVGHLLEADLAAGRFSPSRLGARVGSHLLTVKDDAHLPGGRASADRDDEGTPCGAMTLIEDGHLTGLLTDRRTARRLNLPETGSGRRQDYRYEPLPRSSNLRLEAGAQDPETLFAEASTGIVVTMIGKGAVWPQTDSFYFDVLEGYVLDQGRVGRPVHDLRVRGRASDMLDRVRGIANDFSHDQGRGLCEKAGQVVPVSVGMPTVWIDGMTVEPL